MGHLLSPHIWSAMDKPYPGKIIFMIMVSLLSGKYKMGHLGHPFQGSAKILKKKRVSLVEHCLLAWHGCCSHELSIAVDFPYNTGSINIVMGGTHKACLGSTSFH